MSDSLAIFRKNASTDLQKLAEEHFEHDLTPSDRDTVKKAATKISTHVSVGSLVGLGLGIAMAWKLRSNRMKFFEAFKTARRPTHVKFADGTEEAVPDVTPLMQPSTLGDIATYTFFSITGLFLGGETGILTGTGSAKRTISKDPEVRARVERAFRGFKVDVLRKEIEGLEKQGAAGQGVAGAFGW